MPPEIYRFRPVRRFRRAGATLLISIAAFLIYTIAAVPFIESGTVRSVRPRLGGLAIWKSRSHEAYFAAGSWELERPKMLETDQGTLLFDEYQQSEDGSRMRLNRCTFIYDDPSSAAAGQRPLILRAYDGATLFFDPPLQIELLRFGRLAGGRLTGRITIDGEETEPGKNDEVHIVTRDVQIGDRRIWTPHEVEFRYGPHSGRGRNLSIYLNQRDFGGAAAADSQMGQVESLELLEVDNFEILLAKQLFSAQPVDSAMSSESTAKMQVECAGPFRFDFGTLIASLEDDVNVVHQDAAGGRDHVRCDLLELHFTSTDSDEQGLARGGESSSSSLQPSLLVAVGTPVVIRAPSRGVVAQAERLEFDVQRQILELTDRKRLTVFHEPYTITAPRIRYQFSDPKQLGTFWAAGPGQLTGRFGPQEKNVVAHWEREVRLDPNEDPQQPGKVLRIKGAKNVTVESLGKVSANELELYLSDESESAARGKDAVRVERLRALGTVKVDSDRLTAQLGSANLWFHHPEVNAVAASEEPLQPGSPPSPHEKEPTAPSRYRLVAEKLNALVHTGPEPLVERLDVVGDVRLDELPQGKPNGVFVRADRFTLSDGNTENPTAWLLGQPARGSTGSLQFFGRQIEVQQGRNRVHISGPGNLRTASSSPKSEIPPIDISWVESMDFDGRSATFKEQVAVRGSRRTKDDELSNIVASGETMSVMLTRPVSFQESAESERADFAEMIFRGLVTIDHELLDGQGRQKSVDRMQIHNLNYVRSSGNLVGEGPGWLVHRGVPMSNEQIGLSGTKREGLDFLQIDFAQQLTGNVHLDDTRRPSGVVFHRDVRCLFGTIRGWDGEVVYRGRESLGEHDALLKSDVLAISDAPSGAGDQRSLELQAVGNATIQGRTVVGSGHTLSYSRDKDQLILAGDGRNAARLSYQRFVGAEPIEGVFGKVYFYPKTRTHKGIDLKSIDAPLGDVHFRAGVPGFQR